MRLLTLILYFHRRILLEDNFKKGDKLKADTLNEIRSALKRSYNLTVSPPLSLIKNASGYHIRIEGGQDYELFAQLQAALSYQSSCTVKIYIRPTSDTDPLTLGTETKTVWASPLWNSGDSLDSNTDVQIKYFPSYKRWFVVNAECGEV